MRKFIFLTVMAFFAGSASVNAQCVENELHPAAGVPHTYQVSISNANGYDADGVYQWYITQDAADLLNGAVVADGTGFDVTAASATLSAYNSTGNDTKNALELTWQTSALVNGNNYYLVLKYTENNGTCDAMNMKVMKIEPLNQFKLAIKPVKADFSDFTGNAEVCAADVDGASYNAVADRVTYTYGENTIYYKVTASGFAGQWKPQIKLPALAGAGQAYVSAEWSPNNGTDWYDFDGLATTGAAQELTSNTLATIPATTTADYIYRVVIDNERFETLSNQTLNVGTDGTYGGATNDSLNDKKDDCSADEAAFADNDDYTIMARPEVTATSGGFIQEIH